LSLALRFTLSFLQGKSNSEPVTQLSSGSSLVFSQSHSLYTAQNPGTSSVFGDSCEPNLNFSSPGSLEVTSEAQALRQLEKELNINEDSFSERLSEQNDQGQLFVMYSEGQGNLDKLKLFRITVFLSEGVDKINISEAFELLSLFYVFTLYCVWVCSVIDVCLQPIQHMLVASSSLTTNML